jgi:hypothetical protein
MISVLITTASGSLFSPGNPERQASAMPIDPTDLAKSIGALGSLDPQRDLARTLQQVTDGAKQLFRADGPG